MNVASYKTVYDAAEPLSQSWWFCAYGLIFVGLGWALTFKTHFMMRFIRAPEGRRTTIPIRIAGSILIIFAILAIYISTSTMYGNYRRARDELQSGHYAVVYGQIIQVSDVAFKSECFTVTNTLFCYSDNIMTAGFRHMASFGGPIRKGLRVRVSYVHDDHDDKPGFDNLILRLQIAP